MKKTILASVVALAVAGQVQAFELDMDSKYVTGTFVSTSWDPDVDGPDLDSSTGFGIGFGAPVINNNPTSTLKYSIEVGYLSFGESDWEGYNTRTFDELDYSVSGSAFYGSGKVGYPLSDTFDIYGKLGLRYVSLDEKVILNDEKRPSDDDGEFGILLGFGGEYKVNEQFGVGLEYLIFAGDISTFGVTGSYRF